MYRCRCPTILYGEPYTIADKNDIKTCKRLTQERMEKIKNLDLEKIVEQKKRYLIFFNKCMIENQNEKINDKYKLFNSV